MKDAAHFFRHLLNPVLSGQRLSGVRLRRPPYVGPCFGVDEAPLAMRVTPAAHAVRCRTGVHDNRSGDALHMFDLRQVTAGLLGARQRQPCFVASGD